VDIIQVIKPRRVKWAWHVASMEDRRGGYGLWFKKNLILRDCLEYHDMFRKIILEWILNESIRREWTSLI
jgi:hypothetical protein